VYLYDWEQSPSHAAVRLAWSVHAPQAEGSGDPNNPTGYEVLSFRQPALSASLAGFREGLKFHHATAEGYRSNELAPSRY
jgi:hypothetical protein